MRRTEPRNAGRRPPGPLAGAIALVLAAWGLARPAPAPPAPSCPAPREAGAARGWTGWVLCDPEMLARPLRGAAPLLFGGTLDLNRAPAPVLEVLPGVGPARARALVRERARRPFRSLDDVRRVRGIGPATARGLAGWADAGPEASEPPARGSQKPAQFLPKPSESSYKGRAGTVVRGAH